jgi:hypothetical protein
MRPIALLLAALAIAACSSDDPDPAVATPVGCTAGQSIECTCPGGSKSAQTCKADGSGFDACACGAAGGAGSSGAAGASGSAGAGGAACVGGAENCETLPCCDGFECKQPPGASPACFKKQ